MPLGDYERLECVGKGNQGSVYRVLHRTTGRTFVLKRAELDADDPTLRAAALREAETLGSLQHACVVRYEESFVELDGERTYICIVMEHCAGGDLHRRVEQAAAVVAKGLGSGAGSAGGPPLGYFPEAQARAAPRRAIPTPTLLPLRAWRCGCLVLRLRVLRVPRQGAAPVAALPRWAGHVCLGRRGCERQAKELTAGLCRFGRAADRPRSLPWHALTPHPRPHFP